MGGSENQAKEVYNYFTSYCYVGERLEGIPKDPTITHTENDKGKYFKAVTASPKQVRGPHPDFLLIDEACECKDELILAALPMVNSSPEPIVVITSTFHKLFGLFQETWDAADEMGYTRYSWDIFDVVKPFDPAVWKDKEYNRQIPDFQDLRKLAEGRTGDAEGWVPIENVIQAWRGKPSPTRRGHPPGLCSLATLPLVRGFTRTPRAARSGGALARACPRLLVAREKSAL
jgi:hypothetical protein